MCVGFADVTRVQRESGVNLVHMSRARFLYDVRHVSPRIMQMLRAPAVRGPRNKGWYFRTPLHDYCSHKLAPPAAFNVWFYAWELKQLMLHVGYYIEWLLLNLGWFAVCPSLRYHTSLGPPSWSFDRRWRWDTEGEEVAGMFTLPGVNYTAFWNLHGFSMWLGVVKMCLRSEMRCGNVCEWEDDRDWIMYMLRQDECRLLRLESCFEKSWYMHCIG
jgi:hypothetical protein